MQSASLSLLLLAFAFGQQPPPDNGADLLRRGLLALNRNDLAAARTELEAASKVQPTDPRIWLGLARTYWKSGDKGQSETAASRAIAAGKDNPAIQHGLALHFTETGQWESAATFESQYAAASGDPAAFFRAGSLYLHAKKPKQAIEVARKGLEKQNSADLRNLLGKAWEATGDSVQAVPELQEAIRINPYEEAYYFDLAQLLMRHHNFDVAIQVLEGSRRVIAKSLQLELALGVAYYGQRRFADAVGAFVRTIDLDPEVPQPYLYLSRVLDSAGDRLPEVEKKFAAFAAAHPKGALGPFLLAKAKFTQLPSTGYPPEAETAEKLLRQSLQLKETEWEAHHLLGALLERKGDFNAAAKALKRAIALSPQNPAPHLPLARVYVKQGFKEEAARERTLFQQLTQAQEAAVQERAASLKRLQLSVK